MDLKIASKCIFQLAIFDIVTFCLGMLWKQPLNSLDKGPPYTTACKMRLMRITITIRALCTIIPLCHFIHTFIMYSTILADGRLRDMVNGHASNAPAHFHADAFWGGGSFDGTLGLSGTAVRGAVGVLGEGAKEGSQKNTADLVLASNSSGADAAEAESLDIRDILSKPLPPRPSDVDYVRSQASFNVAGVVCAHFCFFG